MKSFNKGVLRLACGFLAIVAVVCMDFQKFAFAGVVQCGATGVVTADIDTGEDDEGEYVDYEFLMLLWCVPFGETIGMCCYQVDTNFSNNGVPVSTQGRPRRVCGQADSAPIVVADGNIPLAPGAYFAQVVLRQEDCDDPTSNDIIHFGSDDLVVEVTR